MRSQLLFALCVSQGCFPSDSLSLPFSCADAQTCTASQFQRLWFTLGCFRGVSGHGSPTGPISSVAFFPRVFAFHATIYRRLRAVSPASEAPRIVEFMTIGTLSLTYTASHRPPPSWPTLLVPVSVFTTSVTVVSAKRSVWSDICLVPSVLCSFFAWCGVTDRGFVPGEERGSFWRLCFSENAEEP